MRFVIRNKLNPHSPAGIGTDQAAKFTPTQFFVVHNDDRLPLPVRGVINQAAKDICPWSPLIAVCLIFDLRGAKRDFDNEVLVFGRQLSLRPERVVIQIHDLLVRHHVNLWADLKVGRGVGRVLVLDDSRILCPGDNHLIKTGNDRTKFSHFRLQFTQR